MLAIPPAGPPTTPASGVPAAPPPAPISPQILLILGAVGGWALTALTDPAAAINVLAALLAVIPTHRAR